MSFLTLTDIAGFEANVSDGWKADTSLPLVGWRLCADSGHPSGRSGPGTQNRTFGPIVKLR